jgi:hypothetical protein
MNKMDIKKELPWNKNWIKRNRTDYIVLHHIAGNTATIQQINQWHLNNGWSGGCGYNLYVRKDGTIYEGRPHNIIGAQVANKNSISVGIAFEGNYDVETNMSQAQIKAGAEAIKHLKSIYPNAQVVQHKYFGGSACAGRNFPFDKLIEESLKQNDYGFNAEQLIKNIMDNPNMWLELRRNTPYFDTFIEKIYNAGKNS